MSVSELKTALDNSLEEFGKATTQTKLKYNSNSELQEAISLIAEDVFRCLSEFEEAIIEYEKKKG